MPKQTPEMSERLQNIDLDAIKDAVLGLAKTVRAMKNLATRKTDEDAPVNIDDFETIMGIIDAGVQDVIGQLP